MNRKIRWPHLLLTLAMILSLLPLTGTVISAADGDSYQVSGSKTASPAELCGDQRETKVTLSLPSGEYRNEVDIVFVMDNSTSAINTGFDFGASVAHLLRSIAANNQGVNLKVGVVKYRGYATDMLDAGLVKYDDSSSDTIIAAIENTNVPGSGSNLHSGLMMAEELLSADTAVEDTNKYVIMLTDGKSYIWNNEAGEPLTYYAQWYRKQTIQAGGMPVLNQIAGSYNKEQTGPYVTVPGIDREAVFYGPTTYEDGTYFQRLFDSDNPELSSVDTKYDFPCYYSKYYTDYTGSVQPEGTVQTLSPANGTTVFDNSHPMYRKYYAYTPAEGTVWENLNYLSVNPFALKENESGELEFDTSKPDEDFFLWHPDPMQKGLYQGAHYWKDVIDAKYNTGAIVYYKTTSGAGTQIAGSFTCWLEDNSDYGARITEADDVLAMFDDIDNSIRYMVSRGVVTDQITDDFTLKIPENGTPFTVTLDGQELPVTETDGVWYAGSPDEENGRYPYEIRYDAAAKTIQWTLNVPVENLKQIQLSYTLTLREDATEGVYDTNVSAVLDYKSSDGKRDGTYTFEVPQVRYRELMDISGAKTWDDAENQDGKRPESITIHLLADGEEMESKTVTEADDWSWTFTDLYRYDADGREIGYTVTEDPVAAYESSVDGFDVTNTHAPEMITIRVTEIWNDGDDEEGIRPESVTIRLLADGEETGLELVLDASVDWKGQFPELPKYSNGREIVYSLAVDSIDGYTTSGSEEGMNFTFVNTHEWDPDPAVLELMAEKIVKAEKGAAPKNSVFTFALIPAEKSSPMPAGAADDGLYIRQIGPGSCSFGKMSFGKEDVGKTYTYTVKELPGTDQCYKYDSTEYLVTVSVGKEGGAIVLDVTYTAAGTKADHAIFTNVYTEKDPGGTPTGDGAMPALWLGLMVSCLAGAAALLLQVRRKRR